MSLRQPVTLITTSDQIRPNRCISDQIRDTHNIKSGHVARSYTNLYEVDVQPILDNKNNSSVSFSPSAQMHVSMCDMKTIEMFSWRWWWSTIVTFTKIIVIVLIWKCVGLTPIWSNFSDVHYFQFSYTYLKKIFTIVLLIQQSPSHWQW